MTSHIEWLDAGHADVTGAATPGSFGDGMDDNTVAAIRITSQFTGDGTIIQGRPERLLQLGREITRVAELIIEQTMRDPSLRRLYGMTESGDTDHG